MEIDELKNLVSNLDEAICRVNLKLQECAENGIEGLVSIGHPGGAYTGFVIAKDVELSINSASLKINLLKE